MFDYTVVFDMPGWIADGIRSGVMETAGGVVRMVGSKQVVMWLRPVLDVSRVGVAAPVFPLLAGGAALTAAAAAASAAITVVAFALLAKQIGRVETRLDQVLSQLDAVQADVSWLKRSELIKQRAELKSAMLVAETAEMRGDFDSLLLPLGAFTTAQSLFVNQLNDLLEQPRPLAAASAFVEFANLYVLATGAKGRALTILQGEKEASEIVSVDALLYAGLRARIVEPFREPSMNLAQIIQLTDQEECLALRQLLYLPSSSLVQYMPLFGLGRDLTRLNEMRNASVSRPNEPIAGVVVNKLAPTGWSPDADQRQNN